MLHLTDRRLNSLPVLMLELRDENDRQLRKWGVQTASPAEWMLWITEEVGETAEAISEHSYRKGSAKAVVREAIQAATLLLKVAEAYKAEIFRMDKEKKAKAGSRVIYRGYQPKGPRLNPKRPPRGGSGVPKKMGGAYL